MTREEAIALITKKLYPKYAKAIDLADVSQIINAMDVSEKRRLVNHLLDNYIPISAQAESLATTRATQRANEIMQDDTLTLAEITEVFG